MTGISKNHVFLCYWLGKLGTFSAINLIATVSSEG